METSASAPEAANGPDTLRLKVVMGNAAGTLIEVEEELLIGRQAEGDGALANDIEISRRHARIAGGSDGRFVIEDLGSTNGTYLNGGRLEEPTALETGDRIEVGASALVVQVSNLQPTPTTAGTVAEPQPEEGAQKPGPPPFVLHVEVDVGAGEARVSLDEASDEVTLVLSDGRWRLS